MVSHPSDRHAACRTDPPGAPCRLAVATPYVGEGEETLWEWNYCPDCGCEGAHHHDEDGRGGVRCG